MAIAAGTRFGHYEIISLLGAGGMGEVYLAQDTKLPRTIALKILTDKAALNPQDARHFDQEARIANRGEQRRCHLGHGQDDREVRWSMSMV